jgi:hypothetical protein
MLQPVRDQINDLWNWLKLPPAMRRDANGALVTLENIAAGHDAVVAALEKMLAAARCNYDPAVALSEYGAMAEAALANARGG